MSAPAALPLDWCEKHRPRSLDELVGNAKAIEELRAWADSWRDGIPEAERAAVLAGEPGVGKTSAAHALARDLGWGVIELNASDSRNEEVIRRVAGKGSSHRAFGADGSFDVTGGGRQLIILDEADNLFGREDRGGMKAILDTIRETRQPIVLIANDLFELQRKGAALKTLARTIKFGKVHSASIPPALRRIAKKEGLELEPGVDKALAERAGGDLRSAVNDLQALAVGRSAITLTDIEALGRRDTTGDMWGLLGKVFYGHDIDAARKATWDLDETPEDIAVWLDENLPVMYSEKRHLVRGYHWLSQASVFLGRVQRRQQYGLWSYASELMTMGVTVAKDDTRPSGARFQFPQWLRRQSSFRGIREVRARTADKVGAILHTSRRRAIQDHFPYLRALMAQDEEFAAWAAWQFDLEADELAFLLEEKATSARVKKLLEASTKHGVPFRATEATPGAFGRFGGAADEAADDDDDAPAVAAKAVALDDDEDDDAPATPAAPAAAASLAKAKAAPTPDAPETPAKPEAPAKKQRSLGDF